MLYQDKEIHAFCFLKTRIKLAVEVLAIFEKQMMELQKEVNYYTGDIEYCQKQLEQLERIEGC